MSVQFKVRLMPSMFNHEEELRRFAVDVEKANDFVFLKDKISTVFPTLNEANFKLFYKDDRGDMIAFNSDEELSVALDQMEDDVLNITVKNNFGENFNFPPGFPQGAYTGANPGFANFSQPFMGGQGFAGTFPMGPNGFASGFQYQTPNGGRRSFSGAWSTNGNGSQYQAQQQSQGYPHQASNARPYRSHR